MSPPPRTPRTPPPSNEERIAPITTHDSNKFSYSLDSINVVELVDKTISEAIEVFNVFDSRFTVHVEPLPPSVQALVVTDRVWFQESLLCLLEQAQQLTAASRISFVEAVFSLRVSLANGADASLDKKVPSGDLATVPESNESAPTPQHSLRAQSMVVPSRPSALNYSSRSIASRSPRTMRATVAFSPQYQSSLAASTETTPFYSQHSSPVADSSRNISSPISRFLQVELCLPYCLRDVAYASSSNAKFPVHVMEHRVQIFGGRCGRPLSPNSSSLPSISSSATNASKKSWFFAFPYHPLSEVEQTAPVPANLVSALTSSLPSTSAIVNAIAPTPAHHQNSFHMSIIPDEQPVFTPMRKMKLPPSSNPPASSTANQYPSQPKRSLPTTPVAAWQGPALSESPSSSSLSVTTAPSLLSSSSDSTSGRFSTILSAEMQQKLNLRIQVAPGPTMPSLQISTGPAMSAKYSSVKRPIFLVDDSTMVLKLTSSVLARSGYSVRVEQNGLEAVDTICDLLASKAEGESDGECSDSDDADDVLPTILMDLQMPLIDGAEAIRRIRAAERMFSATASRPHRRLVILALSVNNHETIVSEALSAGCDAFLQKPFNLEDFEEVMEQIESVANETS